MIIFVFGDSIAFGSWDTEGGWVNRLKRHLQKQVVEQSFVNCHQVFNLGIGGNTTRHVIERFETEVEARLGEGEECLFIFATGINDAVFRNHSEFESTPEIFLDELTTLQSKAQKYNQNICFVEITPVNETLTNPLKISSTGKRYINNRINAFNAVLYKFCESKNIDLVTINKIFNNNPLTLLADGLHPNNDGHEIIYQAVLSAIKKYLYDMENSAED